MMTADPTRQARSLPRVLMVDDDPTDIELTQMAFQRGGVDVSFSAVRDGAAAIRALEEATAKGRAPDLILLDLNMPVMNGWEVLETLQQRDDLRCCPVVVLSTSDAPRDVARCLALGAHEYLCKPNTFTELRDLMQHLQGLLD
jgi:chemotaxis family two-component system response regulator Rcp1